MTRLLMLVEGQSEEIFVKQTLKPHLEQYGVQVHRPVVLWTKRLPSGSGFRGGVSNWNQIRRNLWPLLHDSDAWVTTLLDFYGLPMDFPGYAEACTPGDRHQKVAALQATFAATMDHPRFIPFFALHEFEAWIFSRPDIVGEHFGDATLTRRVRDAVSAAGGPELINLGADTHPKARLHSMGSGYKETSDGPTLLNKIGVPAILAECPHFSQWLNRLVALG